jgi:hypothetical protein
MTLKHTYEAKTKIELRPAWRRSDPQIERDAELFWRRERVLPPNTDIDERLKELCLAAYEGETLIALTTARIRFIDFLMVKLAMLRVAVASDKRKYRVASILQPESRELLEQWSLANPSENVFGMGTVVQALMFPPGTRLQAYRPASRVSFIGWTANGEQMRVAWFEHATIPLRRPDAPFELEIDTKPKTQS